MCKEVKAASAQRRTYCVADAGCMTPGGVAVEAEGLRLIHCCPVFHMSAQRSKHCPGILAEGLHHLPAVPAPITLLKRLQAELVSRQRITSDSRRFASYQQRIRSRGRAVKRLRAMQAHANTNIYRQAQQRPAFCL